MFDALARVGTEAAAIALKECVTGGKVIKNLERLAIGLGWVRGLDTAYIKRVLVSGNCSFAMVQLCCVMSCVSVQREDEEG